MKFITDIYKDCNFGYFVVYDELSHNDYLNFCNKNWCGLIISDKNIEKKDWISIVTYKKSLKTTIDQHSGPTMIHYLRINKENSNDILKEFFLEEYDLYYEKYEHGFLKRMPFIDVKYDNNIDIFLKKYNYHFNNNYKMFVHDRYKNL